MPILDPAAAVAGAAAATYEAVQWIADWAERSCIIEVANMTPEYWTLTQHGCSSGVFADGALPTTIAPFGAALIKAASSTFAQGAVGNMGYQGRGVGLLMDYSNPVVGNNDLDASFNGPRTGEFVVETYASPGNKNAHYRCALAQQYQENWRFCPKCHGLFANGPGSRCPAGGGHEPAGFEFILMHDLPDGPNLQSNWRFCPKCLGLFAAVGAGTCPAGGGHDPVGWSYNVVHDLPETPGLQSNWRFCPRCLGLFWNGDGSGGRCPTGGGHDPAGWNYCMPHKK